MKLPNWWKLAVYPIFALLFFVGALYFKGKLAATGDPDTRLSEAMDRLGYEKPAPVSTTAPTRSPLSTEAHVNPAPQAEPRPEAPAVEVPAPTDPSRFAVVQDVNRLPSDSVGVERLMASGGRPDEDVNLSGIVGHIRTEPAHRAGFFLEPSRREGDRPDGELRVYVHLIPQSEGTVNSSSQAEALPASLVANQPVAVEGKVIGFTNGIILVEAVRVYLCEKCAMFEGPVARLQITDRR